MNEIAFFPWFKIEEPAEIGDFELLVYNSEGSLELQQKNRQSVKQVMQLVFVLIVVAFATEFGSPNSNVVAYGYTKSR